MFVKADKGGTFAPATAQTFINKMASIRIKPGNLFSKKKIQKACRIRKEVVVLHPANGLSSLRG